MNSFNTGSIRLFVESLVGFIQAGILPLLITAAILFFIWNLISFITNADNTAEKQKSKEYIMYSIIAFFLIFSVWGIVALVRGTIGVSNPLPLFPEQGSGASTTVTPQQQTLPPLTGVTPPPMVFTPEPPQTTPSAILFP